MYIDLDYTTFINRCFNDNDLSVQYDLFENDTDKTYHIHAKDKYRYYRCEINNFDHVSDFNNFETNHKSKCNKQLELLNVNGAPIVAPTLEDMCGIHSLKMGYKSVITEEATNYFDNVITEELKICGGEYWIYEDDVDKVHINDYVEFSIIDKDDVLGLFSYYGLTLGVDILELNKFVKTDYIKKGNKANGYYADLSKSVKGANGLIVGLYTRIKYESNGTQPINLMYRIHFLH
jgi:hypothetical protein